MFLEGAMAEGPKHNTSLLGVSHGTGDWSCPVKELGKPCRERMKDSSHGYVLSPSTMEVLTDDKQRDRD